MTWVPNSGSRLAPLLPCLITPHVPFSFICTNAKSGWCRGETLNRRNVSEIWSKLAMYYLVLFWCYCRRISGCRPVCEGGLNVMWIGRRSRCTISLPIDFDWINYWLVQGFENNLSPGIPLPNFSIFTIDKVTQLATPLSTGTGHPVQK